MKVVLIVAIASNGVIGNKGKLPWHYPEDMKHFRETTAGHGVIMGRKTFEGIGRPLPNRHNVVLSRSMERIDGIEVCGSLEEGLRACETHGCEKVFIIGGKQVYEDALTKGLVDEMIVTEIHASYEGDTLLELPAWKETNREDHEEFEIVTYGR